MDKPDQETKPEHELKATMQIISSSLNIDNNYDDFDENAIIHLISERVRYLLENEKDLLLSYLYRLDVSMKKINNVLKVKDIVPPHQSLAMLIFQRQLERVRTKRSIKVEPIKGWEF